jgi:hypothetical protein
MWQWSPCDPDGASGDTLRPVGLRVACHPKPDRAKGGGAGGIRTLDRALQPYNGLANRRLQPLGHSSVTADMPEPAASRKRADSGWRIPGHLVTSGRLIWVPSESAPLNRSLGHGPRAGGLRIRATRAFRIFHRRHTGPPFRPRRGFGLARAGIAARRFPKM